MTDFLTQVKADVSNDCIVSRTTWLKVLEVAMGQQIEIDAWKHAANEWADTACNGLDWLHNIESGATTDIKKARENMEACIAHCRAVQDGGSA